VLSDFKACGVQIVAVSVDSRDDADKIQSELDLEIPIGYGVDPVEMSGLTGAFYDAEDEEPYLHATGFLLNELGKVE